MKTIVVVIVIISTHVASNAQKIGFLLDSYITDRWYMDEKLFSDEVKKLGGECLVETGAYGNAEEQIELAKKMITEGKVDVLVVVPSDARKAAVIASFAKENNVPLISYDRLILSDDISIYISFNNKKVGNLQAEYALNLAPKGRYILLNGPTTDNNAVLFREGQMEVLEPHIKSGNVTIVGDIVLTAWSEIEAFMQMQNLLLTQDNHPDVIIAANDALANGSIEMVKSVDNGGNPVITGQDADIRGLKNILKGHQTMTVYKSIKALATVAAQAAMKLANNQPIEGTVILKADNIEVKSILLDPVVVDKSNFKETVVQDGHISLAEMLNLSK
ncbi:Xylose ABC transporter, periplasmic xylose-binding protein XylF [Fulvivirga imtechensis AK7]|uniref:Xylose ABC transporter, periplasmic xylose-binding protein XylF n=1 Tax=Fulvivirga imtechensis AK7 TaxID=1237149 RepID=L8JLE0_9BACT|nr:substrate-binding domain-containing protein [Fulvivirga imtechensis]ELR68299.1 Xylose ABC transporter, periplasmic xylose-binding protein XylF [Fulvivirga imtechensis AK7]